MASYNHAAYVAGAIDSVRRQDCDDWELLVADDASTDRTPAVLASCVAPPRVQVFFFTVNREYHMRNYAAARARGEYLAFLNSDDRFEPGKLRKQVEILDRHPHIAAVFTHIRCRDENRGRRIGDRLERTFAVGNQPRAQWLRQFLLSGNCLCLSSAMVRRACFEAVGGFDPLLIQVADLDLWVRLCLRWDVHVIPEPLTEIRILAGRRNLGADNPASHSRVFLEFERVYGHYFRAEGLALLPALFPELAGRLEEDTPAGRHYLLARLATTLPRRVVRLLGFRQLHELLKDDQTRKTLLGRNRRLPRALLLSEGVAALDRDGPGLRWTVRVPGPVPAAAPGVHTFWTAAPDAGTFCLAVPNPGLACRLTLTIEARRVCVRCRRVRLYDPRTGNLVLDTQSTPDFPRPTSVSRRRADIIRRRRPDRALEVCLPLVDFSTVGAKEIDVEVDGEITSLRRRLRAYRRDILRRLRSR
jgi:glycosyltransferase involved in cell wall biosynthesis